MKIFERKNRILAAILFTGAFLRIYGLERQPLSGDDAAVAVSAWNYVDSGNLGPTMWNHPPLRNLTVYASLWLFGEGTWGLKMTSVVLGSLSAPLLYAVSRRIFHSESIAALAGLFLALDPLHIDFSRQAVHEVYMMFFTLAGIAGAFKYRDTCRPFWLLCAGAFFGFGLASKWYVVFPLAATYTLLVASALRREEGGMREKVSALSFLSAALILFPFFLYLLVYTPWFQRGYDLKEWFSLQYAMYLETKNHSGYNPFDFDLDHHAGLWFLKPVAFADFMLKGGRPTILLGLANPLVWLLTLPSLFYLAYKGVKERKIEFIFIFSTFWLSYVPLLVARRPVWAHTAFSVIPFAFMAVSYMLVDSTIRVRRRTLLLTGYVIALMLLSIPLYLLAIGQGLEIGFLKSMVMLYRPAYEH